MSRLILLLCLLLCLFSAGCRSPADLVADGDALMAQKDYAAAAAVYKEVLNRSDVSELDRRRAAIGEAQAFLYRGDLTGAETRLRRMPDNLSAKWYHLAEVALGRRDPKAARRGFQRALDLVHGGDTAQRLAGMIAGEARTFLALLQAADVFKRGGAAAEAKQLRALAEVWRGLESGSDAAQLLKRLEENSSEAVAAYSSVRVLRARLLERAGRADDAAWKLEGASDEFSRWATELRAQEAIERGDQPALKRLLKQVDAPTAARIRDRLATSLRFRGDLRGALAWYQETAAAGGAPALLASAEAAHLLERLGRKGDATDAWRLAMTATGELTQRQRILLARHLVRLGDLLGACARLGKSVRGDEARRLITAAARLKAALAAHQAGDRPRAAAAARATRTLVPGEPAAGVILQGGKLEAVGSVRGATQVALYRALLSRLLRTGDLARASTLLGRGPAERLRDVLAAELYGGVLAALRAGRDAQVQAFLRTHRKLLDLETLRAAAALRPYPQALLPNPRGALAVGKQRRWGSLWAGRGGFRWPLVGLRQDRKRIIVRLPGGGELTLPDLEKLAVQLGGGAARRLGWEPLAEPTSRVAERVARARAGGVEATEPLEVE